MNRALYKIIEAVHKRKTLIENCFQCELSVSEWILNFSVAHLFRRYVRVQPELAISSIFLDSFREIRIVV